MERHLNLPGRRHLSAVLAAGQCVIATMYVFPGLLAPAAPTTTRIVLELSRVGPLWVIWFGATGIALIAAMITHRLLHVAHIGVGSSWIGFTFVLELSAWANHGAHILPAATALLGAVNLVVASSYSRDVRRRGTA